MTHSVKVDFSLLDANKLASHFNIEFAETAKDDVMIHTLLTKLIKGRATARFGKTFGTWRSAYITTPNEDFFNKLVVLIKECEK